MNNFVYRFGSILYALVIGFFGVNHFLKGSSMTAGVPSYLPSPIVWVYVVGGALILAAIAIIINVQSKLASYLLALLLIIFVVTIHLPHFLHGTDPKAISDAMISILKDTGLAAAAIMIAAHGK